MLSFVRSLSGIRPKIGTMSLMRSTAASVSPGDKAALRKRGAGTQDALFGILIMGIIAAVLAQMGWDEQKKITDRTTANQFMALSNAAKSYLAGEHRNIKASMLADVANGTVSPGQAMYRSLAISDLVASGYLPGSVAALGDATSNYYGQEYEVWIRGVLRSDTSWPQSTVTKADLIPLSATDSNGEPFLTNDEFDLADNDDELDLEAVLITVNGETIPLDRGGRVIEYAQSPTAGMIYDEGGTINASGIRGNFEMPGKPWSDLGADLQQGRLLSLLWLSEANLAANTGSKIKGALRRCEDLADETEKETCLEDGNNMWADIVMTQRPSALTVAEAPGLFGVRNIGCLDRSNSSFISGPDGSQTIHSDPVNPSSAPTSVLLIDCDTTKISGNVEIRGEVTADVVNAQTDIQIGGQTIGDNLVIASGVIMNGETSPLPDEPCPTPEGATDPLPYKVDYWVSGLVEAIGRPIAGYRTYEDVSAASASDRDFVDPVAGTFRTSVMVFVSDDHCVNVDEVAGIITPIHGATSGDFQIYGTAPNQEYVHNDCRPGSGTQFEGADTAANPGFVTGDGYPDVYRLLDGQARISYQISCMRPS